MTASRRHPQRRLTHDYRAYVRSLQMSEQTVFGYCEGRNIEPYTYSEMLNRSLRTSHKIDVVPCETVTGVGGKLSMITLFAHLRRDRLLLSEFKTKKFCCFFFMDKDVDDVRRIRLRSEHVLYTDLYDLEGQLFHDCDLQHTVAVGLSISKSLVPNAFLNAVLWMETKAQLWEQWLELCLYSEKYDIHVGCSYGKASKINRGLLAPTDMAAYQEYKILLQTKAHAKGANFTDGWSDIVNTVSRLKRTSNLRKLYKGKWIEPVLVAELTQLYSGKPVSLEGLGHRLTGAITSRFDASSSWATRHIAQIGKVLAKL